MPKGVYIRKRKSARKKRVVKQKQKQKQSQKVNVNVSAGGSGGGGGGGVQYIPVPQYTPPQQTYMMPSQASIMPSQASIMEQAPSLLSGFSSILRNELTNFGRNQNQVETIAKPIMSNVGIQATPFMTSEGIQATPSVSSFGVGTDRPSVTSFGVGTESVGVAPTTFKQIEPLKVSTEGSGDTRTYERMRKEQLEKEAKETEQLPITAQQLKPQQFTIGLADLLKAKSSLRPSGFVPMEERAAPAEEEETFEITPKRRGKAAPAEEETIEITPKRRGRPPKAKEPPQQAIQAEVVPAQKLGTSIATAIGKEITEKPDEGDFGIPVVRGTIKPTEVKPKRTRRTKTEIEEAKAQEELQKAAKQTKPITAFFKPK